MNVVSVAHRREDLVEIQRRAVKKHLNADLITASTGECFKPDILLPRGTLEEQICYLLGVITGPLLVLESDIWPIKPIDLTAWDGYTVQRLWSSRAHCGIYYRSCTGDEEMLLPWRYAYDKPGPRNWRKHAELIGFNGEFFHLNGGESQWPRSQYTAKILPHMQDKSNDPAEQQFKLCSYMRLRCCGKQTKCKHPDGGKLCEGMFNCEIKEIA